MSSLPTLTNLQIDETNQLQHDKSYGGSPSKDQLPKRLANKYYIINLDDSTGPGSHWVLLDNRRKSECLYVDSFGMPPPVAVAVAMQKTGKDLKYNDVDVQAVAANSCGWWCEYFSEKLADGSDLAKVVSFAQHQPDPERYLASCFESPKPDQPMRFKKKFAVKHGKGIMRWFFGPSNISSAEKDSFNNVIKSAIPIFQQNKDTIVKDSAKLLGGVGKMLTGGGAGRGRKRKAQGETAEQKIARRGKFYWEG